MKKIRICFVTGTRAEYGLLYWLMSEVRRDPKFELQIIATGMHLSYEHSLTYRDIEKDGFFINKKIEMLLSSDTSVSISKSTGLGLISFSEAYLELKSDIVIILGDRFEMLAASIAALYSKIPIAHIHGGETTEGAYDESIRHSITKMAWWHFVANKEYERRVIQLGESPNRVFNVGGLGVDAIKKTKLLTKKEIIGKVGVELKEKNLLITFHPVTLENQSSSEHFQSLLDAITKLEDTLFIFTMPNADSDSRIIKDMINDFVLTHPSNSISFVSMGRINYLSTMQFVDGVIGNSSSGLLEAPSFKIGTINIGDRQKGRLKADSVINCEPNTLSISEAITKLYSDEFKKTLSKVENPYGDGSATSNIIDIMLNSKLPDSLKKEFYNL